MMDTVAMLFPWFLLVMSGELDRLVIEKVVLRVGWLSLRKGVVLFLAIHVVCGQCSLVVRLDHFHAFNLKFVYLATH